jgi:hypothetical protein
MGPELFAHVMKMITTDIPPSATAYRADDARATKAAAPEPKPTTPQPSVLDLTDEELIKLLDGK